MLLKAKFVERQLWFDPSSQVARIFVCASYYPEKQRVGSRFSALNHSNEEYSCREKS